jgi:hypothetical protein
MRKRRVIGRFPVDAIARAIANCRPARAVAGRVKRILAQTEVERLTMLCIVLMVSMLIGDAVVLVRAGTRTRTELHYSVIRPVVVQGDRHLTPRAKSFFRRWDSLTNSQMLRDQWDSLLRLRPGLQDTLLRLAKLDSALRAGVR